MTDTKKHAIKRLVLNNNWEFETRTISKEEKQEIGAYSGNRTRIISLEG